MTAAAGRPGLGRLPQFDPRSRAYPIRALLGAERPLRPYTWRVGHVWDQGGTSSCVGHAFAAELVARPVVVDPTVVDPFGIYHQAQRFDEWPGGEYPGASPRYEGTSVLAGAKVLHVAGHYTAYHWAFSERDVAWAVGYRGPVVVGTSWTVDMFTPDRAGFIHPTGPVVGGHAYLLVGVSLRRDCYKLLNSWGPGWGQGGYGFIRRADLALLLADQGEACLPVRQKLEP